MNADEAFSQTMVRMAAIGAVLVVAFFATVVRVDEIAVDRIEREAAACRAVCAPRAVGAWVPSGARIAPGCECAP